MADDDGEPVFGECPLCAWAQLYSWGLFFVLYLISWDASLTSSVNRLHADLGAIEDGGVSSLRRPYLVVLAAYSIVVAWLSVLFYALLLFLACALACMTAPIGTEYWEKLVRLLGRPVVVLHCLDISHAGFHALVMGATLLAASLSIGFYITDDDLLHHNAVYGKMVRILFIAPATMAAAYGLYTLFCIICTM